MLDGYLCGVLVQPVLLAPEDWLPPIFDLEGRPLPDDVDPAWQARCTALILRRHAALNRSIVEDGGFDPLVLVDDPDAVPDEGDGDGAAADPAEPPLDPADPAAIRAAITRSVEPWVGGFEHATLCFPALTELDDEDVALALARLFRHLPPQSDEEREVIETLDRELPLPDLDAALDELVGAVADLADLTQDARYRVETVRHAQPKPGRNDPCPCGSGRKFKQCHGRG
ncbi:UPF0149 family protein [Piscinibacter sakaiensis]